MQNAETESKKQKARKSLQRMNAWMGLALFLIVAATAVVVRIYAAQITNRTDLMSNQAMSSTSNHTVSFNLSGGNTFVAGETILINFPEVSAFTNGGSWAAADFTFTDGVVRTIAGVSEGPGVSSVVCPDGVNNVGVAVDTTALIFRLVPCGGLFTSSAAGAYITFTIGGSSPNGTLTNPSAPGSYSIAVTNGAGDCQVSGDICDIGAAIINSNITVTATVVGDGGGGGGGGGQDITAPVITNIHTQNPTTSTIQVCWDTNEAADSLVSFGPTNTYGSQVTSPGFVTTRCLTLTGLTEGATYHYNVCSKDPSNNLTCSGDQVFTLSDFTPPIISGVSVSNTTCNSATINWSTNEASSSYADYGTSAGPVYPNTTGTPTMVTSHSVTITGLNAGATYHFRARSGDAAFNESFTGDQTFITQSQCVSDSTPPVISNIQVTAITSDSAHVCWDTNEPADATINYGTSNAYGLNRNNGAYTTTRCFDLTGLLAETTYHYQLTSRDPSTNTATTADLTFDTLVGAPGSCNVDCASTVINPYIINPDGTVRKVGSSFVVVSNQSPGIDRYNFEDRGVDVDYNDVVVEVDHRDCSSVLFTSQPVNAAWHHIIRAEIFYHGVLSDDVLLWSDSHVANGNPQTINFSHDVNICDGKPPDITNVRVSNITETTAIVSWDTLGTLSDSTVDYGLTQAYGQTRNVVESVTNHAVVLTGLTKGTTYHYRVSSTDSDTDSAVSTDFFFTTVTDSTPPANASNLAAIAGDSRVTLNWTNPSDPDFAGVKLVRSATGYPTGPTDGTLVYQGTGVTHLDLGVTNGVTYYYALFAHDDVPNHSSGAIVNATPTGVQDTVAPVSVTTLTATPGDARVQLNWSNPNDVDFQGVRLLRKTGSFSTGPTDGTLVYLGSSQSYLDAGVNNGTTYYYTVYSFDAVPNYSAGANASATPSATDTIAPGPATNLTATAGDAQVMLAWQNPADADWAGTRVVRRTGQNPTGPNDGTIVFEGVGDNRMDNAVTNGITYYYGAFAFDAALNFAPGVFDDATPTAALPPPPAPACSDSDGGLNYDTMGRITYGTGQTDDDSCADQTTLTERYCDAANQPQSEAHDCGGGFRCSGARCVPSDAVPSTEICGNGSCADNENSLNCPIDCPVLPQEPPVSVPPSTVPSDIKMETEDLRFFATAGKIQLRVQNGSVLYFYNNAVFTVMIPDPSIRRDIQSAFVNFNGSGYVMRETASYEASVVTPSQLGDIPLDVVVNYADGSKDSVHITVRLVSRPRVYEDSSGSPSLSGARVTLQTDIGGGNFGVWDGSNSGQSNPQVTDADGRFGYILPVGSYKLIVEKDGYRTKTTLPFPVSSDNVLRTDIPLIKLPPEDDVLANVEYGAKVAAEAIREAIGNAYVKENTQDIAAPAVTIATVANVAAAGMATATIVPYLLYLWSLIAHPFMLIARRRRKQWGVVYNSLSKLPLDLAIVRLLDAKTGRVLRSAVTDKDGRYFFIVQAGTYKMTAVKVGHVFPSDLLRGQKEDAKYIDLYHGETIEVKKETTITANVPLDPVTVEKTPRKILLENIGRRLQKSLGIITILAMMVATVITPTPIMFAMLLANVALYLIFRRLAVTKKPKNWGIVYDEKTKKPLGNVVARIFETRFNKLLETQVTDSRGRYAFLVGQNTYYVTFDKPGYMKQQKGPVDLKATKEQDMKVVAVDVKLPRNEGGAAPTGSATNKTGGGGSGTTEASGGGDRLASTLPAMPPQPSGFALKTPVKSLASVEPVLPPTPEPVVPASPVVPAPPPASMAPGESYEEKMLARLKKMTADKAAPTTPVAVPPVAVAPVSGTPLPDSSTPDIIVSPNNVQSPVDKQGLGTSAPSETPAELLRDLKNEASGAQNGTLLPDQDHAHPEDNKPAE